MTGERVPLSTPEGRPQFIETIDRAGRVGILGDDTWMVGWEQPSGQLIWHSHSDVRRVFRQNERVIQRFLGIPIDVAHVQEARSDPNLGVSLPQLREALMIPGEIQKAQQLTQEITLLMSLSVNQRTPADQIVFELDRLRSYLSPKVRSAPKVRARGKLTEAIQAPTIAQTQIATGEASTDLLLRASEGMSIVGSLFRRASIILGWIDKQEHQIEILKNAVGAALIEIKLAQTRSQDVPRQTIEAWQDRFFGQTDILTPTLAIRGNPYAQILKRREIIRLVGLREAMEQADSVVIERRLSEAYPILSQVGKDKKDREASGLYDRYRIPRA